MSRGTHCFGSVVPLAIFDVISLPAFDTFLGIKRTWQKGPFVPQARISGPRSEVLSTYSILHIHTSLKLALLSPSLLRGAFLKMIIMIIEIMIITHPVFQYSIYMHICFHPSNGKEILFPCTSQQNWNNIPFTISESKHSFDHE